MLFTLFCRISNILKNHAFWQTIRIWLEDNFTFLGPCLQPAQQACLDRAGPDFLSFSVLTVEIRMQQVLLTAFIQPWVHT